MQIKHPMRLSSAEFNRNPHSHFAWMRRNQPIYKAQIQLRKPAYLITRYADVEALLTDNERLIKNVRSANQSASGGGGMWLPKAFRPLLHNMLNTDEPEHRRLRSLVHKAFSPRMIRQLEPRIITIAETLIAQARMQPEPDLIRDFALPLPVTVIADMLGIPSEDHPKFQEWTRRIVVNPTPWNLARAIPPLRDFMRYTRNLAEMRRKDPQDDLISMLALAEESGDKLTEDELLGTVFLLLVAGHETTVGLISNGMRALLDNPDQLALLQSEPALLDSAIEELLRYDGPLQTTEMSFARTTFSLHGVRIPQGALVLPALLSANRDEAAFEHPDRLDITRKQNKHLAFGKGIHYCLGAPLARLEAHIAFSTLLEQAPDLRLAVPSSSLHYHDTMMINRMTALPVTFDA